MSNNQTQQNTTNISGSASGFSGMDIAVPLFEKLVKLNYTSPTPIQLQAMPIALTGKDVVGIAQTGTGKTLAFGVPMIQRLSENKGQGVVLLPTRELALQVDETFRKIGASLGLRTALLIGGMGMRPQTTSLAANPHVIIATPGRLNDHLQQGYLKLNNVNIVVLDEADRMLDMGFAPQIEKILRVIPRDRQTMLFSATMPQGIMSIATKYMQMPIRVEVAPSGTTAERVTQEVFIIHKDGKNALIAKLLEQQRGTALIFTRTKYIAKRLTQTIQAMRHTAAEIHSNRSLSQRREALDGFKKGKYRVLVATDIASRGIDVAGISLVINYDIPVNPEDYIHRIGRTARAGAEGHAITLATPEQRGDLRDIERLMRKTLPVSELPEISFQRRPVEAKPTNYASNNREHRLVRSREHFNNRKRSYRR
ncbi:MAG: DEAD/DEAH box helicase [Candidatus Spechtbacteria bacterium]|nr:DEAD/DEAH box helicase [Candidatus Spechtbacteria bacterium]